MSNLRGLAICQWKRSRARGGWRQGCLRIGFASNPTPWMAIGLFSPLGPVWPHGTDKANPLASEACPRAWAQRDRPQGGGHVCSLQPTCKLPSTSYTPAQGFLNVSSADNLHQVRGGKQVSFECRDLGPTPGLNQNHEEPGHGTHLFTNSPSNSDKH